MGCSALAARCCRIRDQAYPGPTRVSSMFLVLASILLRCRDWLSVPRSCRGVRFHGGVPALSGSPRGQESLLRRIGLGRVRVADELTCPLHPVPDVPEQHAADAAVAQIGDDAFLERGRPIRYCFEA